MNIGFEAKRVFNNFTGLGNYARALVTNLAAYYPENNHYLYTPKIKLNTETQPLLEGGHFNIKLPSGKWPSLWRSWGIKRDIEASPIDIFHGLSNELPFSFGRTTFKKVVTIHDLIFKRYPRSFPFTDVAIYDAKFRFACRTADKVIAISESTKRDIVIYYHIPEEKVKVVYQPIAQQYYSQPSEAQLKKVRQKYNLPSEFLLNVGSVIVRKNLLGVIKAWEQLPNDLKIPLVVVGNGKKYLHQVKAYIARQGIANHIIFLHQVTPDELPSLYQLANVFIYPSFYEGFGLPVVEALVSGVPVLTSNVSSMPEAGGPGCYYVDPYSQEELREGMVTLLSDTTQNRERIQQGLVYAERFNAQKLTDELVSLYHSLLDQ